MYDFATYLLSVDNMLIMLSAVALIGILRHVFQDFDDHRLWARLLPVLPVAACSAMVWMPGLAGGGSSEKILLGIVLGTFSGQAYKVVKQSIFGNDKRIRDHPKRL